MKMLTLLAGAAALAAIAVPAHADWPPTAWGMTVKQVLAAVPGAQELAWQGTEHDVWGQRKLAEAPSTDGDVAVRAEFYFDADKGKLGFVRLVASDKGQCVAWEQKLVARYGAGSASKPSATLLGEMVNHRWVDPKGKDRLLYLRLHDSAGKPDYCHLIRQQPE
ncbi:hypothetical protein ACFQ1E_19510 [Sphingomonas canadensis]|uniref:Uncharacterized protein n=1 Tax=Sphingomonas canadensis TaxID=1219257 RepID=A0ABW3HD32_9SPHN|nr:hypothetical protein [Sphingomonas canadensis]MCW3838275.1 hypothetical protein [Sphingomonas canadensis]